MLVATAGGRPGDRTVVGGQLVSGRPRVGLTVMISSHGTVERFVRIEAVALFSRPGAIDVATDEERKQVDIILTGVSFREPVPGILMEETS